MDIVDGLGVSRIVFQLRQVDHIVVVGGGEQVDIAVVIDDDDALDLVVIAYELNAYVVKLLFPVESHNTAVLIVVGKEIVLGQGIDALTYYYIICAAAVGGKYLPRTYGLRISASEERRVKNEK